MTRYHDLCTLAAQYSKQFHEHIEACRQLSARLIEGYAAFLSCPLEKVEQVELDRKLRPSESRVPLTQRVRVINDPEGFVHFAWYVRFDHGAHMYAANELVTFGIRIAGDHASIREEGDFSIDVQDTGTWEPFFEYLHQQSLEGFRTPQGERRGRIGFVVEQ